MLSWSDQMDLERAERIDPPEPDPRDWDEWEDGYEAETIYG